MPFPNADFARCCTFCVRIRTSATFRDETGCAIYLQGCGPRCHRFVLLCVSVVTRPLFHFPQINKCRCLYWPRHRVRAHRRHAVPLQAHSRNQPVSFCFVFRASFCSIAEIDDCIATRTGLPPQRKANTTSTATHSLKGVFNALVRCSNAAWRAEPSVHDLPFHPYDFGVVDERMGQPRMPTPFATAPGFSRAGMLHSVSRVFLSMRFLLA